METQQEEATDINWTITLDDGVAFSSKEINAGQLIAVCDLVGQPTWAVLDPTANPQILIAWLVILTVQTGDEKDPNVVMNKFFARPITELIGMINKE